MQHSTTVQTNDDLIAAWRLANDVAWCRRLSASITQAACEMNRNMAKANGAFDDCRCKTCGGLENQADRLPDRPMFDELPADDHIEGLAALDELIDGLYEEPAPGDDFDDVELDLDEDELLALFPELAGKEEPEQRPFNEHRTAAPRRAVYRRKCIRCEGYMDNIREGHDDTVFRCLNCGWRDSDKYARNRAIHAAGGVIV